jgi:hypothetical protein
MKGILLRFVCWLPVSLLSHLCDRLWGRLPPDAGPVEPGANVRFRMPTRGLLVIVGAEAIYCLEIRELSGRRPLPRHTKAQSWHTQFELVTNVAQHFRTAVLHVGQDN